MSDGQALTEAVRSTSFVGIGNGNVMLDEHGDRLESYEVMNVRRTGERLWTTAIGMYSCTEKTYSQLESAVNVRWPGDRSEVPRFDATTNQEYIAGTAE